MKRLAYILFLTFILCACNNQKKQQELALREARLSEKEQQFAEKETDYQNLLKLRDSLQATKAKAPVLLEWPANLAGKWNTKIVCINSNCSDYAVGDVRNDVWEFVSVGGYLAVNTYSNQALVRTYNAVMDNETVQMHFATDSTAPKFVKMDVTLDQFADGKITGKRKVVVNFNCEANFSVELQRP